MRAVALLGLGELKDRASTPDVAAVAKAADAGTIARAAAAYALGELAADGETPTLLALAQGNDALPRELSLVALARMGAIKNADPPGGKAAIAAMSDAVFAGGETQSARARIAGEGVQRAGTAALTLAANPTLAKTSPEMLPVPDGLLDVEGTLEQLVPRNLAEAARGAALVKFEAPLTRAALSALQTSGDRARSVLDALGGGDGSFKPFVSGDSATAPTAAKAKAQEIGKALEAAIVPLARHPNTATRMEAVVLLARAGSADAQTAVVGAVDDSDESVQRVALAAIGARPDAAAVAAVSKLLHTHENWAMRVLGAQALGRLGAAGGGQSATTALRDAALTDPYALVREAALLALAGYDRTTATQVAAQIAVKDVEPRVRETAKRVASR
jgi:HEAT repeat protein